MPTLQGIATRVARIARGEMYYRKTGYRHTGERVCEDFPDDNFRNHLKVYEFGSQFVSGQDVLDVGSGSGYGSAHLARHGSKSVVGIDYSKEAVEYSRKRYSLPNLTFQQMDAHSLWFEDRTFDFVFSSENLEHLAKPEKNVSEVARVLKPGGLFLVATPNKELSSPDTERPINEYHTIEYTYEALQSLLKSNFANVYIFENSLVSNFATGREMKAARTKRGAVGVDGSGGGNIDLGGRNVSLINLHNTHSFLGLAWS
jgi:2-polyprenyl-3-methyl-5-hydroxy-6-metoxy-1,4-benzoquinol methylase